jgi:hypothetical protein
MAAVILSAAGGAALEAASAMDAASFGHKVAAVRAVTSAVSGAALAMQATTETKAYGFLAATARMTAMAVACLSEVIAETTSSAALAGSSAQGTTLRTLTASVVFVPGAAFALGIAIAESAATKAATNANSFIFIW